MSFSPSVMAAGQLYQGMEKAKADQYNAAVALQQQKNSVNEANAQGNLVQRNSREMLGRQAAAFGAAGVGYGGSSEMALDQSAVNQELDALNTRYKGAITGWGYGAQAQLDQGQARSQMLSSSLLAGAQLLKGAGGSYSSFNPSGAGSLS